MQPRKTKSAEALIEAAECGELDEVEALRLCNECPEVVVLTLLPSQTRRQRTRLGNLHKGAL